MPFPHEFRDSADRGAMLAEVVRAQAKPHPQQGWLRAHLEHVEALAAEIAALGFPGVARGAASALATYRDAPNFGLDALEDRLRAVSIRDAIDAYLAAQVRKAAA